MIIVKILRSELKAAGACHEGMALFETLKSRKGDHFYVKWSIVHQVWASVAHPRFYGWLRSRGLVPQLPMAFAYLGGAYLEGADLQGANLEGANLGGAYLRGAYLRSAYLRGAYLVGANLEGADLQGANLEGANLGGAYLGGAYLGGANLGGAYALTAPTGWKLVSGILVRA